MIHGITLHDEAAKAEVCIRALLDIAEGKGEPVATANAALDFLRIARDRWESNHQIKPKAI